MNKPDKIITPQQAFARMARICSQKECCKHDIRQKLLRLNLPESAVEEVLKKLVGEKYIDEARFARSFVADKLHFNKWGRKKIELALRRKSIASETIESVFAEFPDGSLSESLPALLEKKRKTVTGKSEYEKNGKLIRFALGRGFPMNDVLSCLKKMDLTDVPYDEY